MGLRFFNRAVNGHYCGRAGRKIGAPASAVNRPNLTLNVFLCDVSPSQTSVSYKSGAGKLQAAERNRFGQGDQQTFSVGHKEAWQTGRQTQSPRAFASFNATGVAYATGMWYKGDRRKEFQ